MVLHAQVVWLLTVAKDSLLFYYPPGALSTDAMLDSKRYSRFLLRCLGEAVLALVFRSYPIQLFGCCDFKLGHGVPYKKRWCARAVGVDMDQ